MPCEAENWHVLSHEQNFSKHRFLDIFQCTFNRKYGGIFSCKLQFSYCIVLQVSPSFLHLLCEPRHTLCIKLMRLQEKRAGTGFFFICYLTAPWLIWEFAEETVSLTQC